MIIKTQIICNIKQISDKNQLLILKTNKYLTF